MSVEFRPHEIVWTAEKSANFWDYFSTVAPSPDQYFSYQMGRWILEYAEQFVPLKGRVLDYGCGSGYLIGHLLKRGVACEGLDFSEASVERVEQQFKEHPLFRGTTVADSVPTPLPDASMDLIFCVEVVEHLLDEHLEPTLGELRRLLRPGGVLIVTTPNDEDLSASKTLCPECGCVFHHYQHVRTWSAATLSAAFEAQGLETISCGTTNLGPKPNLPALRKLLRRVRRIPEAREQTLVYVGRRGQA